MSPPRRLRYREAWEILRSHCLAIVGEPPSSNKYPCKKQNLAGANASWWLAHTGSIPPANSPRSVAYLAAYTDIAGPLFFGMGIPLAGGDGFLLPDRGVMKALLLEDYVTLDVQGRFQLTDRGRDVLARTSNEGIPAEDLNAENDG